MADYTESADPGCEGELLLEEDLREPPQYAVYLLNDDYTSMAFVVSVLKEIFYKSEEEATAIMLSVHKSGRGLCGIYTREIAETKVELVGERAKAAGFPLKCTMEEQ